ncbi:hypothetical protein ATE92_0564 [Ulvibacter sp. MAR_2010_11]|uniref:GAF domain-containing protein n=1 Tax=Ulvibacter sp. MAR_2010_11 TaxID=1250229 RepID=UPI000C2C3E11|nr:GAF domain-containing protein [Ulvibacter sp. MAR_2010_11]PKA82435.1 hypothetical protein ATE92_0564 [Ulvibacter sp. MAR_2010_11]
MSILKIPSYIVIAINFPSKEQAILEEELKTSKIAHFECSFKPIWSMPDTAPHLVFWYLDTKSSQSLLKEAIDNNPQTAFITLNTSFGTTEINNFFAWGIFDMVSENALKPMRLHTILTRWLHSRNQTDLNGIKKEKLETLEMEFYRKLHEKITSAISIEESFPEMLDMLLKFTEMDIAEGWIPTRNNNQLTKFTTSHVETKHTITFLRICNFKSTAYGQGLPGTAWKSGKIEIWDSVKHCKNFVRVYNAKRTRIQFAMAVPIFFKGAIEGVIVLLNSSTPNNLDYLNQFLTKFSRQFGNEFHRLKMAI